MQQDCFSIYGILTLFPVDLTKFSGRNSFLFAERFNEIAEIIEAAGVCNIGNGFVRIGQFQTSLVDSVLVQIFDGSIVSHFLEKFTEIVR